jgi:helicase
MTEDTHVSALKSRIHSKTWQNEAAQIKARAYLQSLELDDDAVNWRYDADAAVRHASGLQLLATRLVPPAIEYEDVAQLGRFWESVGSLGAQDPISASLLASIAYELAGSPASSAAVMSKMCKFQRFKTDTLLDVVALLLSRRLMKLRATIEALDASSFLHLGILSSAIISAIGHFNDFLLAGGRSDLNVARDILRDTSLLATERGAVREGLLASALERLTLVVDKRSIWTLVLDAVPTASTAWHRYLNLLARGQGRDLIEGHSIVELWPSQRDALQHGLLDPTNKSLAFRMPTSAGKTRIAELAIVQTLLSHDAAKVVYIAPYRALANELIGGFRRLFGDLGFAVASALASYEFNALEEQLIESADLSVLTPERLDLLMRINADALRKLKLVILDEGHLLEDEQRGLKAELILTRLRSILPAARFLVASALVGDRSLQQISRWLSAKGLHDTEATATSHWRPSIQQLAKFEWTGDNGFIRFIEARDSGDIATFLPGVVRKRAIRYLNERTQRYKTRSFGVDKSDIAAELALRLSRIGPVLVYVMQPRWTVSVASRIEELVTIGPDLKPSWWGQGRSEPGRAEQIAGDWMTDGQLKRWYNKGVAVHNGDLPDALKEAVERDAREGRFHIIVATGTLASGVNMPIRSVIIHSCTRYENNRSVPMPAADYWNVAGRAGRAGSETEGLVVHIVNEPSDARALSTFLDVPEHSVDLESPLLRLAKRIERGLVVSDDADSLLDPEVLALAAEQMSLSETEDVLDAIVSTSLAAQQAPDPGVLDPIRVSMKRQAKRIFSEVPDQKSRAVFSQTGLPSDQCVLILRNLLDAAAAREILKSGTRDELVSSIVPIIINVGPFEEIGVSVSALIDAIQLWVRGSDVEEVVVAIVGDGVREDAAQRIIDRYIRYLVPWYSSAVIRIAAAVFEDTLEHYSTVCRYFAMMVRSGLPTASACFAMSVGVPTRRSSISVADDFDAETGGDKSYSDFRKWVTAIDGDDFVRRFNIGGVFLQDLFEGLQALERRERVIDSLRNNEILPRSATFTILTSREARLAFRAADTNGPVVCQRSYLSLLDRNAVEVVFDGVTIGELRPDDARLVAAELDAGRSLRADISIKNREMFSLTVDIDYA